MRFYPKSILKETDKVKIIRSRRKGKKYFDILILKVLWNEIKNEDLIRKISKRMKWEKVK